MLHKKIEAQGLYKPSYFNSEIIEFFNADFIRCEGIVATYYRKITYKEDHVPIGKVKDYYSKNNKLQAEFEALYIDYNDDRKNIYHGEVVFYHAAGELQSKRTYNNGKLIGEGKRFYPNGTIEAIETYQNGNFARIEAFYENGEKKTTTIFGSFEDKNADVTSTNYHENGKIASKFEGRSNKEIRFTGRTWVYYETGELEAVFNTIEDKKNGEYIEYHKTGIPHIIANFENGVAKDNLHYDIDEDGSNATAVYVENFKKNEKYWKLNEKQVNTLIHNSNQLDVTTLEKAYNRIIKPSLQLKKDFSIELSYIRKERSSESVGLYFGYKDSDNSNFFFLGRSQYSIGSNFEGVTVAQKTGYSGAINAANERNTLKIMKIGDKFSFIINGQLEVVQTDWAMRGSQIGIHVAKGVDVKITELKIKSFLDKEDLLNLVNTKSAKQVIEKKEEDLNAIKTGWKPLVDWQNQLFPSYIISTASAKIPKAQIADNHYIGDPVSVLGIKVIAPSDNAKVKVEIKDGENKYFQPVNQEFLLPQKGTTYVVYPTILWKYDDLRKQKTSTPIGISFKVQLDNKIEEQVLNATLKSINDCPLYVTDYNGQFLDLRSMFAAYVNEEHPMIDVILREALQSKTVNNFAGYQSNNSEDVDNQVFAIWRALQNRGIKYSSITGGIGSDGSVFSQPVRLFEDAINNSQANCIDGTVVFASFLRKIAIDPFLVIVPGHAYLGYFSKPSYTSNGKVLSFIEREPRFLETTMIGNKDISKYKTDEAKNEVSKYHFDLALAEGMLKFKTALNGILDPKEVKKYMFINIEEARKIIKPLGR